MNLLKNQVYTLYHLVSTIVVGNNNKSIEIFKNFLKKNNTLKGGENQNLYKLEPIYDKSTKEYLYSLHTFKKNEYVYYGRLLSNYFRVIHIITEDIQCNTLIESLRNWVSLILSTTKIINKQKKKINKEKLCIIFAIYYNSKIDENQLETKENQIHELITELSYQNKKIIFSQYPLFLQKGKKNTNHQKSKTIINLLQRAIKPIFDSKPTFLPIKINEKILPNVIFPKICKKEYLQKIFIKLLKIDAIESSGIILKLEEYGIILKLNKKIYVIDTRWFHEYIKTQLLKIIQNKNKNHQNQSGNENLIDNSENCICFPFGDDIEFPDVLKNENLIEKNVFIKCICNFFVSNKIWFELEEYSKYYFPPCIGKSILTLNDEKYNNLFLSSSENFTIEDFNKYQIGKQFNINKHCFLGRRIISPQNQIISPNMWFSLQSKLYLILHSSNDWKIYFLEDCLFLNYKNSLYECRCYYRMDLFTSNQNYNENNQEFNYFIKKPYRFLDIHISGKNVYGCCNLLISIASLINDIFECYGFSRVYNKFQINIIPIHFIKNWSPIKNQKNYISLMNILHNLKNGNLCLYKESSLRLLIPDIIKMDSKLSFVEIFKDFDDKEIQFDIFYKDIFNNSHNFLYSDYFRVLLINPKTNEKFICKKRKKSDLSILRYVFNYSDIKNHQDFHVNDLVLFISLPTCFYPICNTPIYLDDQRVIHDDEEREFLIDCCRGLFVCDDFSFLELVDCSNYIQSRDFVIHQIFKMNQDEIELEKHADDDDDDIISSAHHGNENSTNIPSTPDQQHEIIQPARTDKLSLDDYLRICADCVSLAQFAYTFEPSEFVTKHLIQRKLNCHQFQYLSHNQQQIKAFYSAPDVNISLFAGKCCFYTFERAGDLYICIRGTKTGIDLLADLQFNFVPYTPYEAVEKVKRVKKREKALAKLTGHSVREIEQIHDGFSKYADRIIDAFNKSFTELLSSNHKSERRLIICGHSLGGGLAQVISRKMVEKKNPWTGQIIVVTFGSPLVGNLKFSNWSGWTECKNLKIFNFANQKDPIVSLLVSAWIKKLSGFIGLAPDFGYIADYLYVFSSNTARLETKEKHLVIDYLAEQAKFTEFVSALSFYHPCDFYAANIKKLLDDYFHASSRIDFKFSE